VRRTTNATGTGPAKNNVPAREFMRMAVEWQALGGIQRIGFDTKTE
jgi:hypothetical protein